MEFIGRLLGKIIEHLNYFEFLSKRHGKAGINLQ
ncbi:hypothetical protein MASSI9I_70489 [Massilia sp. 9I]|nr:hypothetical protein MASSI9I_70489 [Massilia sp. 9I]